MPLRFQFVNSVLGPIIVEKADPIGINSITTNIKRSADNDGVLYEIVLDLDFIKDGRDYLIACYEQGGGIDAIVDAYIYDFDPNARRWELYFQGSVNYARYDVTEDRAMITLEQTGLTRSVMNALDIDIDLETLVSRNGSALPAQETETIPFHPKSILKQTIAGTGVKNEAGEVEYPEFLQTDVFSQEHLPGLDTNYRERVIYGNMATDRKTQDELSTVFTLPFGWSNMETMGIIGPASVDDYLDWLEANPTFGRVSEVYKADEAGDVDIDIVLPLRHKVQASDISGDVDLCGEDGALGQIELHAWYEVRNSENLILDIQHIGSWDMAGCGDNLREGVFETKTFALTGVTLSVGWKVYVYETTRVYGNYHNTDIGEESVEHHFYIKAQDGYKIQITSATTFPVTRGKVVLLHEAFQRASQYVTNQLDCFRSTLLGRPEIALPANWDAYTVDGDAALLAWTNGNNIRQRDKQVITTISDLLEFVNMAYYTGFGFEIIAGKQVLVVERRQHFFRKTEKILSLGSVANPKKSIAAIRFANQIEYGYAGKVDIGQVNAIDEYNTIRRSTIPIVNTKNALKKSVKVRAGGYQIEYERRLSNKTEDGKLDDENFVVSVIRDGDDFKTKKDEGYIAITGVVDSPSGYNYDISPARCLQNWFPHIAAMLIRSSDKTIKFSGGEVNFLMTSQKTGEAFPIAENGIFDLTDVEPIWDCETYTLQDVPFNRNQLKLVNANPYGYIEFNDRFGNIYEGFILNIQHDPNKGNADFELLKVFRP